MTDRPEIVTRISPKHFLWSLDNDGIGVVTLNRPRLKNPLTFDSYKELRDTFRGLTHDDTVRVVVMTGADGNFCSGGDVHEIIGPLTGMSAKELLRFTRMTGDLIRAIRACPQPVLSAVDGICAGAGAALAMASDLRYGSYDCKTAFLFARVGLSGADMGACAMLPRLIGYGRAADLLLSGRSMSAQEGEQWGFFNQLFDSDVLLERTMAIARALATGPTFAHAMTKRQLNIEWDMSLDTAIESEAQAQALCMQTSDFKRAYDAFVNKKKPEFIGE